MKVTKTVKYNYKLTEETLEKDIESFIEEAREGTFFWDYKNKGLGVKIIRQYFKLLQEKFDNQEYEECKVCYGKLILFLIDSSVGKDDANFGYEDLLFKIDKNFDRFIKNYFICLVKTCEIEELTERVANYAIRLERAGYGFDSDINILITELDEEILKNLEKRLFVDPLIQREIGLLTCNVFSSTPSATIFKNEISDIINNDINCNLFLE